MRASDISWTSAGGDHLYSNALNWSCPTCSVAAYPNNGSGLAYSVFVQPGAADFTNVDISANIDSLTTNTNATVNVLGGVSLMAGPTGSGNGGMVTNSGLISIASGASLSVFSGSTQGLYLQSSGTTSVAGTLSAPVVDIAGGDLNASSAFRNTTSFILASGATAEFTGGLSNLNNGQLGGGGKWDIGGALSFTGGNITDLAPNTTLTLRGPASMFSNGTNAASALTSVEGNLYLTGGQALSTIQGGNNFTNSGSMVLSGEGDSFTVSGQFTNTGIVTINSGANLGAASNGTYLQIGGSTTVNGVLAAGIMDLEGGTLSGIGQFSGSLNNAATINPGDPGTLTITGNYTQTSAGLLILDMDGASSDQYDNLSIGGNVNLGGTIDINLLSSFISSLYLGETFQIATFNSGSLTNNFSDFKFSIDGNPAGDFTTLSAGYFGYGLTFQEVVDSHDIKLEVVQAAPEPSTWILLGAALIFACLYGNRQGKNSTSRLQ